ncbi:MAG: HAMP domain-containing protein [Burkholderiales bacterium]|nr:HAMP domain-containing protein [Burkholderiales bacterium]
MRLRLSGLAARIYLAFLVTAVVPTLVAGLVGIHFSLEALRKETLQHLEREVGSRAQGMGRFFDQLASELLYLASSSALHDVAKALARGRQALEPQVRQRLERDYAAFARAYPHIYQVRLLGADGHEVVRVDRHESRLYTVPPQELQDKSDRYYVHEGLEHEAGQVYVSPLDLNFERGVAESPERPVIRFATPIVDAAGTKRGLLVINLHAAFVLEQIQELAGARSGVAYLFDRSGFYVSRSAEAAEPTSFRMQSVETLTPAIPREHLARIIQREKGTQLLEDDILAYAPIGPGQTLADRGDGAVGWALALSFPRKRLFEAVFNLYLLYGVLAVALVGTAIAGFLLSRRLLGPLELLSRETGEIAEGHFAHRIEIRGRDEIADLGRRFNAMATKLEQTYRALEDRRGELEREVQVRTAALEREQQERRELDRQMFQVEKMTTLGEIAMGLAHEIGNPLAGMKAVTQMLLEEAPSQRDREYLQRILAEVNRLSEFLHTFHGFSAPQDFQPVACRLAQVLDDVLLWTRKEARSRGVTIGFSSCAQGMPGAPGMPALWADPNRLKQVLLNLVINAIHAMPDGGRIEIGMCAGRANAGDLEGAVPRMRFCVRDTGVGIAGDVLPRIFDPFYTTRADGSGLGLAVVKKIAQQHGADITVESGAGRGTCFTLVWPIAPGEELESLRAAARQAACVELARHG